jgi:ATP-grasp domain
LIDEGWSQTLYLALALERSGHPVTVLTANAAPVSYTRGAVRWCTAPAVDSPGFLDRVNRLMKEENFARVLPLTETAMSRLWCEPVPWHQRIFPALEDWQRLLLFDKHALVEHMAARGVPVPRQRRLDELSRPVAALAATLIDELGLPLVLKGSTGVGGARVRIADSRDQLAPLLHRARHLGGSWAAQEYISGPTCLVGGLFHHGRALRLYAAEKLEQHPPRTGPAIRLRSNHHAALLELGCRVLHELRWSGLASADFILRRDGTPVLLEVNPRPWGSIAAAAAAGVDLFTPLAALLAGHEPPADLCFAADRECLIFPRYLLAPSYRSLAGLAQMVRDLAGFQGTGWRRPRSLLHQLVRLRATQHRAPGFRDEPEMR